MNAWLQQSDSLARLSAAADSAAVRPDTLGAPPLPGGMAAMMRAIFGMPVWLWWVLIGLGLCAAVVAAWQAWHNRQRLIEWVRSRPRSTRIGLAVLVGVLALVAAGFGAVSWDYTQHNNGFCQGCHIMTPAFQAMQTSTVHDSLQCHDCHQQPITASMWQLYLWITYQPEEIEAHTNVPNTTCTRCHSGTNETWQRVQQTAGHRVHLESDSSALSEVRCITCHGEEVHRFVPADRTCGQSGCHNQEDTRIVIGPMASQTTLHCITCHQFTEELPQLAALDSARGTLRPSREQCFSCHEMRARLAEFNPARDPHGGQCGMCHDPHTQTQPQQALKQCTTAGCHDTWRDIPFHTGAAHRRGAPRCQTCHQPHAARVDASDCQGCHAGVAQRVPRLRNLPQGFDTTRALRRLSRHAALAPPPHAKVFATKTGPRERPVVPAARDTFEHTRHRALACLTCHAVQGSARLTFEQPRGCQICHHQAPAASRCDNCHEAGEIAPPHASVVTVTVASHAARPRTVGFEHQRHAALRCVTCHTSPVGLAVADSVRQCAACHGDHHEAARACGSCHSDRAAAAPHAPPVEAHARCDACHEAATVARLVPDRGLCLTCHAAQRDHEPGGECTACHFLQEPAAYRYALTGRP